MDGLKPIPTSPRWFCWLYAGVETSISLRIEICGGLGYGSLLFIRQLLIGEPDVAKFDPVAAVAGERMRRVDDLRRGHAGQQGL